MNLTLRVIGFALLHKMIQSKSPPRRSPPPNRSNLQENSMEVLNMSGAKLSMSTDSFARMAEDTVGASKSGINDAVTGSEEKDNTSPSRKIVDFKMEPPPVPKRAKTDSTWTPKQAIDAISTCITDEERMEVIEKVCRSFNHSVQAKHDEELAVGADASLTKHLVFLSYKLDQCANDFDQCDRLWHEIALTCEAIDLIYHASESYVEASFTRLGLELTVFLLTLLDKQLGTSPKEASLKEDEPKQSLTPGGEQFVKKAVKVIANFARIGKATKPLATLPSLFRLLIHLIQSKPEDIPWESRLSALWIVANLACDQSNMQSMVQTPGLVASLVGVCCRPLHQGASLEETMEILRSRSTATRAIANLAWDAENKKTLEEYPGLVEMLAELSIHRDHPLKKSQTIQGVLVNTRRHAVAAIRSLATASKRAKIRLCGYQNGRLLDILTDAALYDQDKVVKDKALAAIHALASQATADMLVNHPALVLLLKDALLTEEETGVHRNEDAPKSHALATLTILERSITKEMPSYGNLKALLDIVNKENDDDEMEEVEATAV